MGKKINATGRKEKNMTGISHLSDRHGIVKIEGSYQIVNMIRRTHNKHPRHRTFLCQVFNDRHWSGEIICTDCC